MISVEISAQRLRVEERNRGLELDLWSRRAQGSARGFPPDEAQRALQSTESLDGVVRAPWPRRAFVCTPEGETQICERDACRLHVLQGDGPDACPE